MDLDKDFDCVPHRRLLITLQSYGITGKPLDWIKDFLADRKQRVSIRGSFSDWVNIFVNDMPINYQTISSPNDHNILQQDIDQVN